MDHSWRVKAAPMAFMAVAVMWALLCAVGCAQVVVDVAASGDPTGAVGASTTLCVSAVIALALASFAWIALKQPWPVRAVPMAMMSLALLWSLLSGLVGVVVVFLSLAYDQGVSGRHLGLASVSMLSGVAVAWGCTQIDRPRASG